jgi:hypothetical protein
LIVSRKDQAGKKKLSPATNHRNTTKGAIKGGFDRTHLFESVEKGFDKLFNYDRQLTESFEYYNTMKNRSITDKLKMQERQISSEKENKQPVNIENKVENKIEYYQSENQENKKENIQNSNHSDLGLSSVLGLLTLDTSNKEEEQIPVKRKKKKPQQGFRR